MVMQIINTHVELRCQGELRHYEIDDIKLQFESTTIPDNNINSFSSYSGGKNLSGGEESASLNQAHRSS